MVIDAKRLFILNWYIHFCHNRNKFYKRQRSYNMNRTYIEFDEMIYELIMYGVAIGNGNDYRQLEKQFNKHMETIGNRLGGNRFKVIYLEDVRCMR